MAMTLRKWKQKVVDLQGSDLLEEPSVTHNGKLCFRWGGYTYGCLRSTETAYITPPETAWVGREAHEVHPYNGSPIDWGQEVPRGGVRIRQSSK